MATNETKVGDVVHWKHWADKVRIRQGTVVKIHETGIIEIAALGRSRRRDFCKPNEVVKVISAEHPR